MFKKLFFIIFIIIFFTACSKKIAINSYSNVVIPLAYIENVNTTIEGSSNFIDGVHSFLPSEFQDHEILKHDPTSPYILHIIEKPLKSSTKTYETQEEKTVKYVDYIFDSKQKKTIPIVKTKEIIYFQKCLETSYTLSASVTTRYKRDTIFATIKDERCLKRRFNIFNQYELQSRDSTQFYHQLVDKLTLNIKNYLVPYRTQYSVKINDEIDSPMSDIDKNSYENVIDMMEDGIFSDEMLLQLVKLQNKYPSSYSINYNLGLLYEYIGENKNALFYYKKCLNIKMTKDIMKRITTIKKNRENKKKIQL